MNSATAPKSSKLTAATAGFVLAAAITVLFNTALAWAKDASAPLTDFMTSLTGHHWTTHGAADLLVFAGLGILFTKSGIAEKMDSNRLIGALIGAVVIAALGLALWFAFV
jgi:hypothetical protein